jgi:uncharacterized protein (DUF58 family)
LGSDRQGARVTRRTGQGLTFAGHRGYVAGDDLRHLDWNLLARLDRPFMKLFEHESDTTVHLLIDATRSMNFGTPTKFLAARRIAAVLAYIALGSLDRVVIGLVDESGARLQGPHRGRAAFFRILEFLAGSKAEGDGPIERGLRMHAAAGTPGMSIVFSDFFDESLPEALLAHRFRKHQLTLVQLLTPEERDPTLEGDLRLVDSESGAVTEITVGPRELSAYHARLAAHRASLRSFAMRNTAGFLTVPAEAKLEHVIWDHMLSALLVGRR